MTRHSQPPSVRCCVCVTAGVCSGGWGWSGVERVNGDMVKRGIPDNCNGNQNGMILVPPRCRVSVVPVTSSIFLA